jgi:low affinity Fe/Cu permease
VSLSDRFARAAHWTAEQCGRAHTFIAAILLILVWGISGPVFHYSDTWQLVINTGATIITFLMVFLIQNTQDRDAAAIQLKLDELIRANKNARNAMLALEDFSENQIKRLKESFAAIAPAVETLQEPIAEAQKGLTEAAEATEKAKERLRASAGEAARR